MKNISITLCTLVIVAFCRDSASPRETLKAHGVAIEEKREGLSLEAYNSRLLDGDLRDLYRLGPFYRVGVAKTKMGDPGFAEICRIRTLRILEVSDTRITNAGFACVEMLAELEVLAAENTLLSDAGLAHIRTLSKLTKLELAGTGLTDAGMASLKGQLHHVDTLALENTAITDTSVDAIASLGKLMANIRLQGTRITPAGCARIRKAQPSANVECSTP